MNELWSFYQKNAEELLRQLGEHLGLTFAALTLAALVGIPFGIFISRRPDWARVALGFTGVLQTIPSLALLGIMIPLLGIGPLPAIVALFAYSLLPIVRNTYTGLTGTPADVRDAALGMGMTPRQMLWQVELPLALPVLFAGLRTAAVIDVGVATLASYVAAGGLGEFIFGGIALNNEVMILAGAIPAALLALLLDAFLHQLQKLRPGQLRIASLSLLLLALELTTGYAMPWLSRSQLMAGFTPEFNGRSDGYPKLKEAYGLDMKTVILGPALMYEAVREGTIDVISGYATDGRIPAYDLAVLEDDRQAFPPYEAAFLWNGAFAEQHPDVVNALKPLCGRLSDSLMRRLNFRVDEQKVAPREVARDYLIEEGLLDTGKTLTEKGAEASLSIGSKIFSEQYILAEMASLLVARETGFQVETETGLGGTKICFDALVANEIQLYVEYTGTGWQVLLPEEFRRQHPGAGRNPEEVYRLVKRAFAERYQLHWMAPLGFNNAYALMMRRAQADQLGMETISDLKTHLGKAP